jgi:putative transposase
MGRRGNPYDNAKAESFMKTLKCEEIYLSDYRTLTDVIERLPRFIDEGYNTQAAFALGYRHPYSSSSNGARPPPAPLGQHPEGWPARCITPQPRIRNLYRFPLHHQRR